MGNFISPYNRGHSLLGSYMSFSWGYPTNQYPDRTAFALAGLIQSCLGTAVYKNINLYIRLFTANLTEYAMTQSPTGFPASRSMEYHKLTKYTPRHLPKLHTVSTPVSIMYMYLYVQLSIVIYNVRIYMYNSPANWLFPLI